MVAEVFPTHLEGMFKERTRVAGAPLYSERNLSTPYRKVTSDYTATNLDQIIDVDTTAGNVAITLPVSISSMVPRIYRVRKSTMDVNTVTVQTNAANGASGARDTLNGGTTATLRIQHQEMLVIYGGYGNSVGFTLGVWVADILGPENWTNHRYLFTPLTLPVATDFVLTGWGTGASVTVDAGTNDIRGSIMVTCGTTPSANPTVDYNYKDGGWGTGISAPWVVPYVIGTLTGFGWIQSIRSLSAWQMKLSITPTAANNYRLGWHTQV